VGTGQSAGLTCHCMFQEVKGKPQRHLKTPLGSAARPVYGEPARSSAMAPWIGKGMHMGKQSSCSPSNLSTLFATNFCDPERQSTSHRAGRPTTSLVLFASFPGPVGIHAPQDRRTRLLDGRLATPDLTDLANPLYRVYWSFVKPPYILSDVDSSNSKRDHASSTPGTHADWEFHRVLYTKHRLRRTFDRAELACNPTATPSLLWKHCVIRARGRGQLDQQVRFCIFMQHPSS
jgi:hypothetical protein